MGVAQKNKKLRYYRIQQMYKYLQEFSMATSFINENITQFFTVGIDVIYLAMQAEPITDCKYEHLDLDRKWAEQLVKKVQSKQYRAQKERERKERESKKQLKLL